MLQEYPTVRCQLDEGAFMPERAHPTDAGADIRAPRNVAVPGRGSAVIHTGVHIETPSGCATLIKSKSGLNVEHDITAEGVIDEGYDGEIVVKVYNHGDNAHLFHRGDKVTQLLIMPVLYSGFAQVERIGGGERGSGGFGSTGV